jgi:signal transduction histidine kinase
MAVGQDGTFLVSYQDSLGISQIAREGETLRVLRHWRSGRGELPTDAVFSVHTDRAGGIWLNTHMGVVLLTESGYRAFGRASGIQNPDMMQGAFHADSDGRRWFATSSGVSIFDVQAFPWNLPPPRATFTALKFGDRTVALPVGGMLEIKPRENTLEAALGCTAFSNEKMFLLEARMDGLEEDWHPESDHKLRYAGLRPGPYTLRVRAVLDGKPGPEEILSFEILPRWYQTWIFRGALGLSFGPLLWGLLAFRHYRLRAHNTRLESLVQARTVELEGTYDALREAEARSQRDARLAALTTMAAGVAHELATPVATIALVADELAAVAPPDLQSDMTILQQETKRCRRILATLRQTSGEPVGETPVLVHWTNLAAMLQADFPMLEITGEAPPIMLPPDALQRALRDLLTNAAEASSKDGCLRLGLATEGNFVRLELEDRGQGMSKESLARLGEPFFTTKGASNGMGLGVFLARTFAEQCGGNLTFESAEGHGTRAILHLPIGSTHV